MNPVTSAPRIAMVAGEASGDQLGADLIRSLRARFPAAEISGVTGPGMRAAGCHSWYDCAALAVMGLSEVVRHLPGLLRLKRDLIRRIIDWRPDVFVGIDAPDFNLRVAAALHSAGIPTAHYVSPTVWAWRQGRVKKIARSVDLMLCLLPFEPEFYAGHGVDARFVGHPLADRLPHEPDRAAARRQLGLAAEQTLVAVLPGSRGMELQHLGSDFAAALSLLHEQDPGLGFVAPMATPKLSERFTAQLREHAPQVPVTLVERDSHAVLAAADVALLASGTAALEALLCKRPMVVAYRLSGLTRAIVQGLGLLKIERYSLPNLLAGEPLVPELVQAAVTPAALAAAVQTELGRTRDPELMARFNQIHSVLACNASEQATSAISDLLTRQGDDSQ